MTVTTTGVSRAPRPSTLADVLDLVLDKGIVIDAYVRVSLVGIELLTIDARVVIASVDTYLHFAEAVNRLDLQPQGQVTGLPGLVQNMTQGGTRSKTKGALGGVASAVSEVGRAIKGGDEDGGDEGSEEDGERADERDERASESGERADEDGGGRSGRRAPANRQSSRRTRARER